MVLSVRDRTYCAGVQTIPGGTLSLLFIEVWMPCRQPEEHLHPFRLGPKQEGDEKSLESDERYIGKQVTRCLSRYAL